MRKSIAYDEPIPAFDVHGNTLPPTITTFSIEVNSEDEYTANMAIITNPERGITNIREEILPDKKIYTQEQKDSFVTGVMAGANI